MEIQSSFIWAQGEFRLDDPEKKLIGQVHGHILDEFRIIYDDGVSKDGNYVVGKNSLKKKHFELYAAPIFALYSEISRQNKLESHEICDVFLTYAMPFLDEIHRDQLLESMSGFIKLKKFASRESYEGFIRSGQYEGNGRLVVDLKPEFRILQQHLRYSTNRTIEKKSHYVVYEGGFFDGAYNGKGRLKYYENDVLTMELEGVFEPSYHKYWGQEIQHQLNKYIFVKFPTFKGFVSFFHSENHCPLRYDVELNWGRSSNVVPYLTIK